MKHRFFMSALLLTLGMTRVSAAIPSTLDSIRDVLDSASTALTQEKAYIHLDNTCYFVGDTIWYKAYVVRADNLHFTDMSRILYVELLSPDGLVVDRQQLIISDKGFCCGDFALKDSLYSGFYEIRAYTRWMLNFNVGEHKNMRKDRESFYNFIMAKDYFRTYQALYSRVIPIYTKPASTGEYSNKRMYVRPKQRIVKPATETLAVKFYPEGGHRIKGTTSYIAFEVQDQEGKGIDIKGTVTGGPETVNISTTHQGRGTFTVKEGDWKLTANFVYGGKNYAFHLPEAEDAGMAMHLGSNGELTAESQKMNTAEEIGVTVLCRGKLVFYDNKKLDNSGRLNMTLPLNGMPTGVNDLTLFDYHGKVLADRLFFINHHDYDRYKIKVTGKKESYKPYEKISLDFDCQNIQSPANLSIAVRDNRTDELTYNNGDIMTDLLLSSELKGFIAYPAYYFEKDDAIHQLALDQLMMVQGWRRYNWTQLADTANQHPRYTPEKTMTVEGGVYKTVDFEEIQPADVSNWRNGQTSSSYNFKELEAAISDDASTSSTTTDDTSSSNIETQTTDNSDLIDLGNGDYDGSINHKGLEKEVTVKMDMILGKQTGTATSLTKNGHYLFQIPPFYGKAILFIQAYDPDKSAEKEKAFDDKTWKDESAWPRYYVKRDLCYPIYARKYGYYENHMPEWKTSLNNQTVAMDDGSYLIKNINVNAKGHGTRAIDYNKPAWMGDAYQAYNDITDYGLSFGKLNFRMFPVQICSWLYGNMGRYRHFNVDAMMDGYRFYRNYSPDESKDNSQKRSNADLFSNLQLKRIQDIKIYTDFEPRNEDAPVESRLMEPDFTINFITVPDQGERPTYRDRRYLLNGFYQPDDYYQPDYSKVKPQQPNDYRRTLYWNPNAKTDEKGHFNATFYNNSKETDIVVSAEGITEDGKIVVNR